MKIVKIIPLDNDEYEVEYENGDTEILSSDDVIMITLREISSKMETIRSVLRERRKGE
jgi:hypothetical protein